MCRDGKTVVDLNNPKQKCPDIATKPAEPTASAQPVEPTVLLSATGSGLKRFPPFTTTGDWTIAYAYNCANFPGGTGNFVVTDVSPDNFDVYVNQLGTTGQDSSYVASTGRHLLEVNSECLWSLKVYSN